MLWCGVLCTVVLCCVMLYCVVLCCVVLCCVVLCCVVWCGVVCQRRCYQKAKAGMSTHGYRYTGWAVCVVCTLYVSVLWHSRTSALSHCLADACAQSHRVSFAHCTLRAALHHQCLLCGAALLGALHHTALCVPCCTVVVGRGQWAVELLQCTAALPGGSGQWTSCNALPHYLGAVGSGPPAIDCLTAWGSGQCNSCNALPHCLGAVGSGPPALHRLTAWGQCVISQGIGVSQKLCGGSILDLSKLQDPTTLGYLLIFGLYAKPIACC